MANDKLKNGVIAGKAMWSHLDKADEMQGKPTDNLTISLIPSKEDVDRILQECQEVWDEFMEDPANKKKHLKGEPNFGEKEDEAGNVLVKFKCKDKWKLKDGTEKRRFVPIFDSVNQVVTKKLMSKIGNGSNIVVAYQLLPYIFTSTNFGVSMRLQAIQVLKLVEYGGEDAESFGFSTHAGGFEGANLADEPENDDDGADASNEDF